MRNGNVGADSCPPCHPNPLGSNHVVRAHSCAPLHLLLLSSVVLFGCVPVDQLPPGSVPAAPTAPTATTYPDLESNSVTENSTHFTIKAYSQTDLDAIKLMAESDYTKIGNDTGLYTFMSSGMYTLFAYRDKDEYMKKTHQPSWSHAVATDKAIYFYYPDPDQEANLIHQMVHMVFNAYLAEKVSSFRWLMEGLAMNEEVAKMSDADKMAYQTSKSAQLRQDRVPFSQMTFFVTNSEEKRRTDAWYQQVESVVTYILSQGSPLAFTQFLGELKLGTDIDKAIADSYAGKFRNMDDLENLWKYTI
jgi:hypothetical protein